MPRKSHTVHEILGPVAHYRKFAKTWLKDHNVSRSEFVALLDGAVSSSEFNKLMSPSGPRPVVRGSLLEATAKATKLPVEMWAGFPNTQSKLYDWVVAEHPQYADSFWGVVSESLSSAHALIGWGSVLPCSLEPVSFMRAHHNVLSKQLYDSPTERERFTEIFNRKGEERRKRLRDAGFERPWPFIHIMFEDDIRDIVSGRGGYAPIPLHLRRQCATQLLQFLRNEKWRIELRIVASSPETDRIRARLRAAGDSVVVVQSKHDPGQGLLFMRDREGNIRWSMHSSPVGKRLDQLNELRRLALPHPAGTTQYLERLIDKRSSR